MSSGAPFIYNEDDLVRRSMADVLTSLQRGYPPDCGLYHLCEMNKAAYEQGAFKSAMASALRSVDLALVYNYFFWVVIESL